MAKKPRKREWYIALYDKDAERAKLHRRLPTGALLFDDPSVAYGTANSQRMKPKRDENNEVVTDEEGYAQLEDHGKIVVIGINGKHLNWENIEHAPKKKNPGSPCDAIQVSETIPLNVKTVYTALEESEEAYKAYRTSPLARRGGLEYDATDSTGEDEPSTSEL